MSETIATYGAIALVLSHRINKLGEKIFALAAEILKRSTPRFADSGENRSTGR